MLDHARTHLAQDSDFDKRIALISIDNAVELMMIAFIEQSRRASGVHIPRRSVEEARSSFPSLLDAIEEFAADRLHGVDLSDIESYHRLRNQLYHGGVGLTVERQKVQVYLQLAQSLFDTLFGVPPSERPIDDAVANFLTTLEELRRLADQIADNEGMTQTMGYQKSYIVLSRMFPQYESVRVFRNNLVHSTATKTQGELEENQALVDEMTAEVKKALTQEKG